MVRSAVGNGDDVENMLPLLLRARLQRDEVELDEALLELRLRDVASDLVKALLDLPLESALLEEDALALLELRHPLLRLAQQAAVSCKLASQHLVLFPQPLVLRVGCVHLAVLPELK